jgi:hypothetical protein
MLQGYYDLMTASISIQIIEMEYDPVANTLSKPNDLDLQGIERSTI